jgi:hypothetical protein
MLGLGCMQNHERVPFKDLPPPAAFGDDGGRGGALQPTQVPPSAGSRKRRHSDVDVIDRVGDECRPCVGRTSAMNERARGPGENARWAVCGCAS